MTDPMDTVIGASEASVDSKAAESHIAEVMTKPFSPREMLGRVHALLHASGAGPQTQTSTARPAA